MKKLLFIFSIALLLLSSCTDLTTRLFDRIPEDKFPENETQAALMMIPVFSPMQQFLDWGGWWFAQEITSDEVTCPTRDQDWYDGGKWIALHRHEWSQTNNDIEAINSMWYWFNKGVFEANKLIEFVEPSAQAGNQAALVTMAKVKVMRSYYYWLLIDNYGDVPFITSFSKAPANPVRNYRYEIWHRIVNDIEQSLPYIPESGSKYSVTKGMAFSLLARLYLNAPVYLKGHLDKPENYYYQKVVDYCDSVINLGQYDLEADPLAPFVTHNEASVENIFTIGYDENTYKGFNLHMRTLHYENQKTYNMPVKPWNGFAVQENFYDTYSNNDKRKKMFLVGQQYSYTGQPLTDPGANGDPLIFNPHIPALYMTAENYTLDQIRMSGARVVKFEVKLGATANLSNDYPIFRYADILLMKAEALIRMNGPSDPTAVSLVNQIRERAGLSEWSSVSLDSLLAERGREMFWEASRRQDLIRFGKFGDAWWEKPVDKEDKSIFPIPKWAIESNPNLSLPPEDIQDSTK